MLAVVSSIRAEAAYRRTVIVYQIVAESLRHQAGPVATHISRFAQPCGIRQCLLALSNAARVDAVAALLIEEEDPQSRGLRGEVVEFLESLGEAAEPHAAALCEVLRQGDPPRCSQAIRVLRRLGTTAAQHVAPLLREEDARFDALDVLGSLGSAAAPYVEALLEDEDEDSRVVASRLLKRLSGSGKQTSRVLNSVCSVSQETARSKRRYDLDSQGDLLDAAVKQLIEVASERIKRSRSPPFASLGITACQQQLESTSRASGGN